MTTNDVTQTQKGFIPKGFWRECTRRLEPTSTPDAPLAIDVSKLPRSVAEAPVHKGKTRLTVGQLLDKLNGKTQFTFGDLAEICGVERHTFTQGAGSNEFRAIMCKLLLAGRVVPAPKGRGADGVKNSDRVQSLASKLDEIDVSF